MTHQAGNKGNQHHPLEDMINGNIQLFDLKQMIDHKASYKKQARQAIRELKEWRRSYAQQTDMVELLYGSIEGVMLRRRAEDYARLYWLVRCDVRKAVMLYVQRLKDNTSYKYAA